MAFAGTSLDLMGGRDMLDVMLSGCWVLVPLKAREEAKSRLSPALDASHRAGLRDAMLLDVIEGLMRSRLLSGIAVYGPAPEFPVATPAISQLNLHQPGSVRDMSMASADGAGTLAAMGAEFIAIVPGDLPLVDGRELDAAFAAARSAMATIVIPDRHGSGTNGMVFPAGAIPRFQFGGHSFSPHCEPEEHGARAQPMELGSFAIDIDTAADLAAFRQQAQSDAGLHTLGFINAHIPPQVVDFCSMGVAQ